MKIVCPINKQNVDDFVAVIYLPPWLLVCRLNILWFVCHFSEHNSWWCVCHDSWRHQNGNPRPHNQVSVHIVAGPKEDWVILLNEVYSTALYSSPICLSLYVYLHDTLFARVCAGVSLKKISRKSPAFLTERWPSHKQLQRRQVRSRLAQSLDLHNVNESLSLSWLLTHPTPFPF